MPVDLQEEGCRQAVTKPQIYILAIFKESALIIYFELDFEALAVGGVEDVIFVGEVAKLYDAGAELAAVMRAVVE